VLGEESGHGVDDALPVRTGEREDVFVCVGHCVEWW